MSFTAAIQEKPGSMWHQSAGAEFSYLETIPTGLQWLVLVEAGASWVAFRQENRVQSMALRSKSSTARVCTWVHWRSDPFWENLH